MVLPDWDGVEDTDGDDYECEDEEIIRNELLDVDLNGITGVEEEEQVEIEKAVSLDDITFEGNYFLSFSYIICLNSI